MSTPAEALNRLDGHARELDALSKALTAIARQLDGVDDDGNQLGEPGIEQQYQDVIDEFEVGLYWQCQEDDGPKWPGEAMREKLARKTMRPELLGRRDGLVRKRERIKRRIGDLKTIVDSERSVLSALKTEAEAGGGGIASAGHRSVEFAH